MASTLTKINISATPIYEQLTINSVGTVPFLRFLDDLRKTIIANDKNIKMLEERIEELTTTVNGLS